MNFFDIPTTDPQDSAPKKKQVKCKSGITGWQMRVRKNWTSLEELKGYDETFGIAKRLGYDSAEQLWDHNPVIRGSVNPDDLELAPVRTVDKIVDKVSSKYGAPMGRAGTGTDKPTDKRVYDCRIPMSDRAYDKGGAYWGMGSPVRVSYTKDLSYIHFYREGDEK